MTSSTTLRVVAPLALAAAAFVIGPPATAGVATCNGKPATIVATPDPAHPSDTTVTGTNGPDVIYVPGYDSDPGYLIDSGGGDDTICGAPVRRVDAGAGNDWVDILANYVVGGSGDDTLTSAAQDIDGGDGDDNITVGSVDESQSNPAVVSHTVVGGRGSDTIEGSADADAIWDDETPQLHDDFADGADVIDANGGNDMIMLNTGHGTTGSPDLADGGPGKDQISFLDSGAPASIHLSTGTAVGAGGAVDHFVSSEGWVTGTSYDDVIHGTSGDDMVDGGFGTDTIDTYAGNDQVFAKKGIVHAGSGEDVFKDRAATGSDGVRVRLGAGNDADRGGDGTRTVWGGAGNDRFVPRRPNDGGLVRVTVHGGSGKDTLSFREYGAVRIDVADHVAKMGSMWSAGRRVGSRARFDGIDRYLGSNMGDVFRGRSGAQRFEGGGGNDWMYGGSGNDVLLGGGGYDRAWGGRGHDLCRAEQRHGCERR